jgi:hypothetical protein
VIGVEPLVAVLNADVPAWVAALIGFVSNVRAICRGLFLAWRGSRKLAWAVSGANRYVTSGIRRWLGVPQTVSLTQAEYDALPVKDPNTVYLVK